MPDILGLEWGVTVEQVSTLAPHIPIQKKQAPAPGEPPAYALPALDPVFKNANTRIITEDEVLGFIETVTAIVRGRVLRASKLPDTAPYLAYLAAAGAGVIANGAAHYLVAAAFPLKAGTNDNTSYAEVLRLRFEEGLAELLKGLADALEDAEGEGALPPGRMFPVVFTPTEIRFPDAGRF